MIGRIFILSVKRFSRFRLPFLNQFGVQCLYLTSIAWVTASGTANAMGNMTDKDYANPGIQAKAELNEARSIFKAIAKKEPNRQNLINSILDTNVQSELVPALNVLELDSQLVRFEDKAIFLKLFQKNPDASVKLSCGKILLKVDRVIGIARLKDLANDTSAALMPRILAASALLDCGELSGYPVVRKSFLGNSPVEARLSAWVMAGYSKFEGKPYSKKRREVIDTKKAVAGAIEPQKQLFNLYLKNQSPASGKK
jgi:hypothetical protein